MKKIPLILVIAIVALGLLASCSNKPAAKEKVLEKSVSELLGLDSLGVSKYEIIQVENLGIPGARRMQIRATVGTGLDSMLLLQIIDYIIVKNWEKYKPITISVLLYKNGEQVDKAYTVAMSTFAPYGLWENAADDIALSSYKRSIDYNPEYFK